MRKRFDRVQIHIRLLVIVRQQRRIEVAVVHGGVFLELEPVAGKMLRMQLDARLQGLRPVAFRLAGQTVDKVETDIFKACAAGIFHRLLRLLEIVPAAYHF